MKRVLQIGMSYEYGGIENFVMNNFRNINSDQFVFDFINPYTFPLAYSEEIFRLGGKIWNLPDFHHSPWAYYKRLKVIMRQYDIVHIHMLSASNLIPLYVARSLNVKKIIVHSHNTKAEGILRKTLHLLMYRLIKKKANLLLACSFDAGKWMFGKNVPFKTVQNAIDLAKFEYSIRKRQAFRKELNVGDSCILYGNVGRLNVQKNQKYLIDVFFEISKKIEDSMLCIVGEGELKNNLVAYADSLGIGAKILFLGKRHDMDFVYNGLDAIIMPSLFEGLPITLVEAQANGLKCYASEEGIPQETNLLGTINFLKLADGPQEWAKIIASKNVERYTNARNILLEKGFGIESSAKVLEKIYS